MSAASFQYASANRKLGKVVRVPYPHARFTFRPTPVAPFVCSTFVSIEATCDDRCAFKRKPDGSPGGCYVDQDSFMRRAMLLLDKSARGRTALEAVADEVALIDKAWGRRGARRIPQDGARGGRDLRLHVGGDVPNRRAAEMLAGAAARWRARGGGAVWTYTHSWMKVQRAAFGSIAVLASVETDRTVREAVARGYAPALVVDEFPNGKRLFSRAGTRFTPCPAETLKKTCAECRLCLDVDLHGRGLGIAFAVHGGHGENEGALARNALVQLRPRRSVNVTA